MKQVLSYMLVLSVFLLAPQSLAYGQGAFESFFGKKKEQKHKELSLPTRKDIEATRGRAVQELETLRSALTEEGDSPEAVWLDELIYVFDEQLLHIKTLDSLKLNKERTLGEFDGSFKDQPPFIRYLRLEEISSTRRGELHTAEMGIGEVGRLLQFFENHLAELEKERRQARERFGEPVEAVASPPEFLLIEMKIRVAKARIQLHQIRLVVAKKQREQNSFRYEEARNLLLSVEKKAEFNEESYSILTQRLKDAEVKLTDEEKKARRLVQSRQKALDRVRLLKSARQFAIEVAENEFQSALAVLQGIQDRRQLLDRESVLWKARYFYANKTLSSADHGRLAREGSALLDSLREEREELSRELSRQLNLVVNIGTRDRFSGDTQGQELLRKNQKALTDRGRALAFQIGARERLIFVLSRVLEDIGISTEEGGFFSTQSIKNVLLSVWRYEVLVLDQSSITFGKLISAFFLFLVGIYASRRITRKFGQRLLTRIGIASGVAAAVQSISYYLLIVFFGLLALHIVHIPLTIFTLVGGALAIGIGFGSQNIVNNFFSGLILLFEQPIRVGDIIEFSGVRGTVQRIGGRSTVLLTPENHELVVPNSALVENNVLNWTLGNTTIRRSLLIGVSYGSPTRQVGEILIAVAREHGKILNNPPAEVLFMNFGDSALDFELRFWVAMRTYTEALRIESDLRHMIDQRFKQAGIVIAFPQRDVHLDTSGALQVRVLGADEEVEKKDVVEQSEKQSEKKAANA